jgi:hypothetical protein
MAAGFVTAADGSGRTLMSDVFAESQLSDRSKDDGFTRPLFTVNSPR